MGTKTISLSDDAYERLKAEKREGESFSDVVRRLTARVDLQEFHGVISDATAASLETAVTERRSRHAESREDRRRELTESLDDS